MDLRPGERGVVIHVRGGDGVRRRAYEVGLVPGKEVEAMLGSGGGARVVRVGESRLVVSGDVAGSVLVAGIIE